MTFLERSVLVVRVIAFALAGLVLLQSKFARGDSAATGASARAEAGALQSASGSPSATVKVTRDARGRKVQYVDFSEAVIEGKARAPEGFVIQSRASGRFNSLIELRNNFRENMDIHALEGATLPPLSE
ncbi:MAG: hypothetical protein FJY29_05025 [Betaproteobacteria bacterium]|nr:hypothetical protein [Betaproteobacteria bacterium]